ncbi:MAG TPA: lipoprotein insertase outer membrane protein LolB [Casimicrobiaceae bacterium]|nr:lipoprotein insertase outer membrane protein LolB [Casimicrobiaceae bacterium]
MWGSFLPRRSLRPIGAAVLAAALLGACAPGGLQRTSATARLPAAQAVFEASGRLSARHGADALAANFQWRHAGEGDELELSSPLGQTIAMLTGDGGGARMRTSQGRVLGAPSWTELTREGLGWPLPVDGLEYWIQGVPRPGASFAAEPDADGRVAVLRQDGWTIAYQGYVQRADDAWRPTRMTATYPEVELRLAIDRWR